MQRFYIHVILFQWKMTVCQGLAIDGYKLIIFWCYFLITFGTTWNYWESLGTIWIHLEPFDSIRKLGTICNHWNYLEPFCPFGTIWNHLEPFGTIWNHLEPYWTIGTKQDQNHLTIASHCIFSLPFFSTLTFYHLASARSEPKLKSVKTDAFDALYI